MSADTPPELQPELLDEFFTEADEHLKTIQERLAALEPSLGKAQADPVLVEELFRRFHSFKGISAIVGLRAAEALAHKAEDFLRELTRGRSSLTSEGLDLLMTTSHGLERIVAAFRSGGAAPNVEALLHSLDDATGRDSGPGRTTSGAAPGDGSTSPPSNATAPLDDAEAPGTVTLLCTFVPRPDLDARGVNINSVRGRLATLGHIVRAEPKVEGQGKVSFQFVIAARETPADITLWEADGIRVELIDRAERESVPPEQVPPNVGEIPASSHNPFLAPSHVVRVDLNRLDDLMRITGELVILRSRFETELSGTNRNGPGLDFRRLREVNAAFARSLRELREAIMRVRLVPVAEIFSRMPFVVRDLARDTRKQVRLTLEGQQTELDKYLVERLKDPLLHLVRNAFSHGVETPEERIEAGKQAEASILLRAWTEGDTVLIQIRDDGRGINPEAVRRRATAQGLSLGAATDPGSLLKILCAPGFSTREDADRAAGRGVGMTVVNGTVRELGGAISLETDLGRGTTFTLRLPLTLAIAEMFIISAAGQTCAVPQSCVREVIQVEADQIRTVHQVEVAPYRSGVLPLRRLSSLFRQPASVTKQLCVLVLSSDRGSAGLVVEQVHGQKEVVVQAMRDPLIQAPGIIGATELGNGRPVLILDCDFLTSGPVRPRQTDVDSAPSAPVPNA